jgi:hypothetical protein
MAEQKGEERIMPPRKSGGPMIIVVDEGHEYQIETGPLGRFTVKFQKGPTKEAGMNGIQCDEIIRVLIDRLVFLNDIHEKGKYRNRYNALAITKLEEALWALEERTRKREYKQIEGTSLV